MKPDIAGRADLEVLMNEFYAKVQHDDTIGYIFTEVVNLDFAVHIPIICDFWESMLFGKRKYRGNVMATHIHLDKKERLLPEHFDRWSAIFHETVDSLFEGTVTNDLKNRVELMRKLMLFKVESSRDKNFIQ